MGGFLSVPILALAAILQVTIVPQFSLLGGRPDLVFLLVVAWALNSSLDEAIIWAFAGGILKDLLSINALGTSVVGMVLVVFGIYLVRQQIYRVGFLSIIWIVLLGTVFQLTTVFIILFVTGFQPAGIGTLGVTAIVREIAYVIPPTIVYNLVSIFPIYWLVRRIQTRVAQDRRIFR